MARLRALLELFQALGGSPRKGVLLNLTGVPVASHGLRAVEGQLHPSSWPYCYFDCCQSSAMPWPKPWELWCAAFKGSGAAFVEA